MPPQVNIMQTQVNIMPPQLNIIPTSKYHTQFTYTNHIGIHASIKYNELYYIMKDIFFHIAGN